GPDRKLDRILGPSRPLAADGARPDEAEPRGDRLSSDRLDGAYVPAAIDWGEARREAAGTLVLRRRPWDRGGSGSSARARGPRPRRANGHLGGRRRAADRRQRLCAVQ